MRQPKAHHLFRIYQTSLDKFSSARVCHLSNTRHSKTLELHTCAKEPFTYSLRSQKSIQKKKKKKKLLLKMADIQIQRGGAEHHISGSTVLYATIASLVIGGPLLGMMGFSLLATTTLVLVTAPLMLLFSPVVVPAGFVLAGSMVGFGVAVGMALVGLSTRTWAFMTVGWMIPGGLGRVLGMVRESGERVKEQGMDFGGYLQQKIAGL